MNGCAVNDPLGAARSTWSSLAPTNALMATRPSPPGRFSTTTGWPQRLLNRSPIIRVPISTPLPGPSVTMNFTAPCGQVCAFDGCADRTRTAKQATPQDKHGETGDAKCKTLHAQQWYLRWYGPRVKANARRKAALANRHRASLPTRER